MTTHDLPPDELLRQRRADSPFPNVIDAERDQIERLDQHYRLLRQALAMADGLLGMSRTEHYKQFLAAVQDIQKVRLAQLLVAKTDREAAVLSGRCQELETIMTMMTQTENNRARLAAELRRAEDRLHALQHPEDKEFLT